ncbi:MAG: glycosyltransferase [Actinomycetota bacterium]|nr:glycosyltransferase [Actinomycetota bacterium]
MTARARRVAIMTGVCTRHDAISNVVRTQQQLLTEAGYDARVITQHTDFPSEGHIVCSDPWLLQRDPWYRSADLVILHFGIQYGLFDSLVLSHPSATRVVHFHNVTPPDLLTGSSRVQAVRGIDQLTIATRADAVWSDSAHNTECLLEWTDVDPAVVTVMPLSAPWVTDDSIHHIPVTPRHQVIRVLGVGRFVPAKGQRDIVEAAALLRSRSAGPFQIELVGALAPSDPDYLDELRDLIAELEVESVVQLTLDPSDAELQDRYVSSDVFVTASRHEGFCVPVVEALLTGCRVVSTDSGALAETVGPCGRLVPVGDVEALADALGAAIDDARNAGPFDADVVADHLSTFTIEAFTERTLRQVDSLIGPSTRCDT